MVESTKWVCTTYEQSTVRSKWNDNFHGAQTLFTLKKNPHFMVLSGSRPIHRFSVYI